MRNVEFNLGLPTRAAAGGLGGCPFAPEAAGNIATEDLADALKSCGVETGVNIKALFAVAAELERWLGRPVGGRTRTFYQQTGKCSV